MEEVEVGSHRIAYQQQGEGPPLVLLHGWPTNSRDWRRQLDALSDEFTVVAWDAPGAGRSSDPPDTFRLADWADCLAGFIEALSLERPHVAGFSWGGGLALELFNRHPAAVRTLVLAGAYAGWGGSLPAEVAEQRLALMVRNSELPPAEWAPALIPTLVSDEAGAEVTDELASIIAEFHPAAMEVALRAFTEADLRDVLPRIDVPTLLIYGEQDVRAPQDVREPLHSGIAGSELVLVPGAGHAVNTEAAARFNSEVRAFLRAQG